MHFVQVDSIPFVCYCCFLFLPPLWVNCLPTLHTGSFCGKEQLSEKCTDKWGLPFSLKDNNDNDLDDDGDDGDISSLLIQQKGFSS